MLKHCKHRFRALIASNAHDDDPRSTAFETVNTQSCFAVAPAENKLVSSVVSTVVLLVEWPLVVGGVVVVSSGDNNGVAGVLSDTT